MNNFVSAVLILLVCSSGLFAADLKTYKATYEKEMGSIVLENGVRVSTLNESYKKALSRLNSQVTKAGDLVRIKAVMAEMRSTGTSRLGSRSSFLGASTSTARQRSICCLRPCLH